MKKIRILKELKLKKIQIYKIKINTKKKLAWSEAKLKKHQPTETKIRKINLTKNKKKC